MTDQEVDALCRSREFSDAVADILDKQFELAGSLWMSSDMQALDPVEQSGVWQNCTLTESAHSEWKQYIISRIRQSFSFIPDDDLTELAEIIDEDWGFAVSE